MCKQGLGFSGGCRAEWELTGVRLKRSLIARASAATSRSLSVARLLMALFTRSSCSTSSGNLYASHQPNDVSMPWMFLSTPLYMIFLLQKAIARLL